MKGIIQVRIWHENKDGSKYKYGRECIGYAFKDGRYIIRRQLSGEQSALYHIGAQFDTEEKGKCSTQEEAMEKVNKLL